jgi:hypothetical protein
METVNVTYLGSNDQFQQYSDADLALVNKSFITPSFGGPTDYIEFFVKDIGGQVIGSDYFFADYTVGMNTNPQNDSTSEIFLDPEKDVRTQGFNRGSVNTKYSFFRKLMASGPDPSQNFWIKEVSTSRTEIKAARQDLGNTELATAFNEFNGVLGSSAYYPDFLLNFGIDVQIIAVNAVYVEEEGQGYVLFKLYEPLPSDYDLKSTFWVVSQVASPVEYNVTINVSSTELPSSLPLRGPNYKVNITDRISKTTPYYNYASLFLTSVSSSYQQLKSMMDEKGIQINVDYGSFNNFIHFSSATERLYNFAYKVQQIESSSAALTSINTDSQKVTLQDQIDNIITKFDGYEYYLYFTSASTAWPKTSTTQPFPLYSATSSQVVNWLGSVNTVPVNEATMSMYFSSSRYDNGNQDWLLYTTPGYIRDDGNNAPYLVFLDMIGQHFDNIWIYLKDLSNRYSAENNPFVGVSMDQVGDSLRSFGINLYTNTSVSDNIYYSLLGINQTGSALPVTSSNYAIVNPISSSLFAKSGSSYLSSSLSLPPFGDEKIKQYVTTFVSASAGVTSSFATLPSEQLKNEIYKRLYHNLAYLLNTKGTEQGVKALITTYGIPNDILTVSEYGGYSLDSIAGIQEINTQNITTGSVLTISSSLLSPYTTLQYYENNYDRTSPNIEVGFSPTDAINASITSSGIVTSSAQPGWFNIMQLIGDPNLQYSSSYIPLVQLEDNFFSSSYTGNAETGLTRYNIWDFVRSVKYYNNSLFKMMKDFVPARANLSSGIIIRSHILERNKYPRHEPYTVISGSVGLIGLVYLEGSAPGGYLYNTTYTASVPVQYQSSSNYFGNADGFIPYISNTGVENFTGQYSGSNIGISNYFPQVGVSSYLAPNTSSIPYTTVRGNIMFTTYSLNYLINNVSGSVISQKFLDLDYNNNQIIPTNYGLITQSISQTNVIGPYSQSQQPYSQYAQVQDYNYYLRRSTIPRYSGSFLSGLYYNIYTPQNSTYSGDISYGDSPIINYYTSKLGLFTQIQSSSFIPGVVNASLAYQADVSGGLSELNQNNINWQDIQNTYKAGSNLTIKQFDNRKYSNQVGTDGVKAIYNSGYNYTPELYFNTSSDSRIYFSYEGGVTNFTLLVQNQSNFFISGTSAPPRYLANPTNGFIYTIFDNQITDTSNYYTPGTASSAVFPSFSVPYAGNRSFNIGLDVTFNVPVTNQQATYSLSAVKNNTTTIGSVTQNFKSNVIAGSTTAGTVVTYGTVTVNSFITSGSGVAYPGPFDIYNEYGGLIASNVGAPNCFISTSFVFGTIDGEPGQNRLFANLISDTSNQLQTYINTYTGEGDNATPLTDVNATSSIAPVNILSNNFNLTLNTDQTSFSANDIVTFRLRQQVTASNNNFTASVSVGSLSVTENQSVGSYPYAASSTAAYINSFGNTGSYGIVNLGSDLSTFFGYQQIPYFVSGSPILLTYSSSLYTKYGDINTSFNPQQYDKIILQDVNGIVQNLDVYSSGFNGSYYQFITFPTINPSWVTTPSLVQNFLLLRRYDDEQNIILTFNKPVGQTSYGFLIADTTSPQITNNINTLQAAVQSQLLSTQTGTTNQ